MDEKSDKHDYVNTYIIQNGSVATVVINRNIEIEGL